MPPFLSWGAGKVLNFALQPCHGLVPCTDLCTCCAPPGAGCQSVPSPSPLARDMAAGPNTLARRSSKQHSSEELRFTVGDRVECRVERKTGCYKWTCGTIVALEYRDSQMPSGMVAPYQVELDDDEGLIYAPKDDDRVIRVIVETIDISEPSMASLPDEPILATKKGEVKKLVKWLRKGNNIDSQRPDGDTLLHTAVMHRQPDLVRELLKRGATVDLPNKDGGTPLMVACQMGARLEAELLLQHSANVNWQSPHGATALMTAAAHDQPEAVSLLLAAAAVIDTQTKSGYSALMSSAGVGADKCVELLLDAGANIELQNTLGYTALKCAQLKGHASAQLLLERATTALTTAETEAPPSPPPPPHEMTIKTTDFRLTVRPPTDCSTEERRHKRSLHRATGLLARAMRD